MTNRRLELHEILCDILGSRNVYYQPPASIQMNYPAIVYGLDNISNIHANDGVYLSRRKYAITVIDKDPDSKIVDDISHLPTCQFNRHYQKDNLYHDVFTVFY